MQKKVLKLKKVVDALLPLAAPVAVAVEVEKPKKVLKIKKAIATLVATSIATSIATPVTVPQEKPKKVLVLQKGIPVPPVPTGSLTKAMEAFEELREYYSSRDEPIPQADIKWFYAEIEQEKKDNEAFWADCSVTKAYLDALYRDATVDEIDVAVAKAQIAEKKKPVKESDIGEMPTQGTPEFWAWCMKRKKLRLQKEAEIIAAGGTVPAAKPKKSKAPKAIKPAV